MKSIFISLIFLAFLYACSTSSERETLPVLNQFKINVPEPSGLSFGKDFQSLWVVSDNPDNRIYEIELDGTIIQKLPFSGEDLEAIAFDAANNVIWVAEEQNREIIKLNLIGTVMQKVKLNIPEIDDHGLEGIAINPATGLWIANEKSPLKIFSFNMDFQLVGEIVPGNVKDISGMETDVENGLLWIISDESEKLVSWNITTGKIKSYNIPVSKAEGIAVNPYENRIYIVSDEEAQIYVFGFPDL